jgi:hypothetical protein
MMARDLGLDDVVDHFTLIGDELDQLRNKPGATRLGFAVLFKFLLCADGFRAGTRKSPTTRWRTWRAKSACRRRSLSLGVQPVTLADSDAA